MVGFGPLVCLLYRTSPNNLVDSMLQASVCGAVMKDLMPLLLLLAAQVCNETYGASPEVVVSGDLAAKLSCVPAHLDYMLYELLKNSMRAVIEKHRPSGQAAAQPWSINLPQIQACAAAFWIRLHAYLVSNNPVAVQGGKGRAGGAGRGVPSRPHSVW